MEHPSKALIALALLVGASTLSFDAEALTMRWGFDQPGLFGSPWPTTADLNFSTEVSISRGTSYQLVAVLEGFEGESIYSAQVDLRERLFGRVGDEMLNSQVAVYGPPAPPSSGNPMWEWGRYRGEGTFYLDRMYYTFYAEHNGLDPNAPLPAISGNGSFARIFPASYCLVDYGATPPPPDSSIYVPYYYPCTRTFYLSYWFNTTAGRSEGRAEINIHVAEPNTLALLGLGLAGIGLSRRRKAA